MKRYPAEKVNPPEGVKSADWIKSGFKSQVRGRSMPQPSNQLLSVGVDGVIYSAWLFIAALGLTLIYGVMKIVNVTHGSFYALGAYAAASLTGGVARARLSADALLRGAARGRRPRRARRRAAHRARHPALHVRARTRW